VQPGQAEESRVRSAGRVPAVPGAAREEARPVAWTPAAGRQEGPPRMGPEELARRGLAPPSHQPPAWATRRKVLRGWE
jgi:hypothetical protein